MVQKNCVPRIGLELMSSCLQSQMVYKVSHLRSWYGYCILVLWHKSVTFQDLVATVSWLPTFSNSYNINSWWCFWTSATNRSPSNRWKCRTCIVRYKVWCTSRQTTPMTAVSRQIWELDLCRRSSARCYLVSHQTYCFLIRFLSTQSILLCLLETRDCCVVEWMQNPPHRLNPVSLLDVRDVRHGSPGLTRTEEKRSLRVHHSSVTLR